MSEKRKSRPGKPRIPSRRGSAFRLTYSAAQASKIVSVSARTRKKWQLYPYSPTPDVLNHLHARVKQKIPAAALGIPAQGFIQAVRPAIPRLTVAVLKHDVSSQLRAVPYAGKFHISCFDHLVPLPPKNYFKPSIICLSSVINSGLAKICHLHINYMQICNL